MKKRTTPKPITEAEFEERAIKITERAFEAEVDRINRERVAA